MYLLIFLTSWFLLSLSGGAVAMPAIGAAVAAVAATIGTSTIVQFAIGIALKVGVGLLQRAQQKKQVAGIKGSVEVGGDNPQSAIVGTYATAGQLEWVATWGNEKKTPNAYLTQVFSLSDLPVTTISNHFYVNGEHINADMNNASYGARGFPVYAYRTGGNNNHMWFKRYDGKQTVADPLLVGEASSNTSRKWLADQIGRGIAYVVLTAQVNRELFTGPPQALFQVQGIPLYDPRKDTTVGGSGGHRWMDQSTWEFSDNPAVVIYNVLRGFRYNNEHVWGGKIPANRLPLDNWFAAMNECDREISGGLESTAKQFRCGAEIRFDQEPIDVIESLLASCNAKMAEIGGVYKIRVGAPVVPTYAFTDEQIVVSSGQSFEPFLGLESVFNGMSATYPEPEQVWQMKEAPIVEYADLVSEDEGRRLYGNVSFEYVPFRWQVQRLSRALVETSRRFRSHNFTLPPSAAVLEPLDVVLYTSKRNGYTSKQFEVDAIDDLANIHQNVALKEVDPSDYSWNSSYERPVSIGPVGPQRPAPQPIEDFAAFASILEDDDGNARRPAIDLRWNGDQPDVDFVRFEVRQAWDLQLAYTGQATIVEAGRILLSGAYLMPLMEYEIRARYGTYEANRPFDWSGWIRVKMLDVRLGKWDIYPIDIEELNQGIQDLWEWHSNSLRYVREEQDRIGKILADVNTAAYTSRQNLRTELTATTGYLTASFTEEILTATGPNSAIAARIEQVETHVNDVISTAVDTLSSELSEVDGRVIANSNAITSLNSQIGDKAEASAVTALTTRVDQQGDDISAFGMALTSVSADVDALSAQGLLQITAEATPAGALSRIGLSAKASAGGGITQAALFLEAIAGNKSRVVIDADEFVISSGARRRSPFVFTNGVAALNVANIGTITAGVIQSPDGRFVINVAGGSLEWFD